MRNSIDEEPDRYERIPRAESHRGCEDMEDFIAAVEDEQLAELLEVAINGRGAFRRFKDVLARHPEEKEKWFRFRDERMEERALEWLDDIGISLAQD